MAQSIRNKDKDAIQLTDNRRNKPTEHKQK